MLTKQDVQHLKSQVEFAMEVLLRAADERVSWKQTGDASSPKTPVYVFLPGGYTSIRPSPQAATLQSQQQEEGAHDAAKIAPLKSALSSLFSISQAPLQQSSLAPVVSTTEAATEGDGSKIRIILHGDNTFEYAWTMKRSGARAMEFTVEMEGCWAKPVLNRTRRGEEDQRISLSAQRIRFQRLSNYGRFPIYVSEEYCQLTRCFVDAALQTPRTRPGSYV